MHHQQQGLQQQLQHQQQQSQQLHQSNNLLASSWNAYFVISPISPKTLRAELKRQFVMAS